MKVEVRTNARTLGAQARARNIGCGPVDRGRHLGNTCPLKDEGTVGGVLATRQSRQQVQQWSHGVLRVYHDVMNS